MMVSNPGIRFEYWLNEKHASIRPKRKRKKEHALSAEEKSLTKFTTTSKKIGVVKEDHFCFRKWGK